MVKQEVNSLPRCVCSCGCIDLLMESEWITIDHSSICNQCANENHITVFRKSDPIAQRLARLDNPYYSEKVREGDIRLPILHTDINHVNWVIGRVYGDPIGVNYIRRQLHEFMKARGMIYELDILQLEIDRVIISALDEYLEQRQSD